MTERHDHATQQTSHTQPGDGRRKPLTIVMVLDAVGNRGNGTSNSALQWAQQLKREGHHVRLVGIGAPEYPAQENLIPFVSWISRKQQMHFAKPSDALFRRAFEGADIVHIYMPFNFGRHAMRVARSMGLPVTAGFHVQPENITYSAGPLRWIPGVATFIYWLFRHWMYSKVDAIHVPSDMGARLLRKHHYRKPIHVISNGYDTRFTPPFAMDEQSMGALLTDEELIEADEIHFGPDRPMRIVASGRLSNEKDQRTLIKAISLSKHADDITLTIAGTGPIGNRLRRMAKRLLKNPADIGFHANSTMPQLLRSQDLLVHPSIVDLESLSVIEGMACGLVPVVADSPLSAAGDFALDPHCSFPVKDAQTLAERIDWWFEHPAELVQWRRIYAKHTQETYRVAISVHKFLDMEHEVLRHHRES
ncbi:glycosyl transferase [Bifidobacterium gallicum DSM 20093 = LMG 11596]|nr:glycosyl transferase [Bifidobacterium gallicum DSM 20093 = LMG 11596]